MSDITNQILIQIRDETRRGLERVDARFDDLIAVFGRAFRERDEMWAEHERWLREHDVKLRRLEGRPPRPRPDRGPPRR